MTEQSFLVVDQGGTEYRIKMHPVKVEIRSRAGTHEKVARHALLTEDGERVEYIQPGRYVIRTKWGREIPVVACDPDAP